MGFFFSKELENLIQATLVDGILEDYEKAAIVKRAKAEGVDLAELEIYINSILQKRKKEHDDAEEARQEKIDQKKREAFGRVCPNCGRQVPPMTLTCVCGFEFTNNTQVSSTQALADKIDRIKSERYGRDEDEDAILKAKNERIINAISMFAVPNNKEDIIEFLSLAAVNSKKRCGLWGTLSGRFKIFGILVLVILIVGINFLRNCGDHVSDGEARDLILITALPLIFGSIIIFCCGLDIIRTNNVAKAWRNKFTQTLIKARSLRPDPDFSERLDYFENLVKPKWLRLFKQATSYRRE